MTAKRLPSQVRRKQIVQVCMDIIAESGLSNLNVTEVASRIGIGPSALYRHFRNKDEMLSAVINRVRENMTANLRKAGKVDGNALDKLETLRDLGIISFNTNRAFPRILLSDVVACDADRRHAIMHGVMKKFRLGVATILREGQGAGLVRSDIAPETLSLMFLGLFVPATVLNLLSSGEFDIGMHVRQAWPAYLDSICA